MRHRTKGGVFLVIEESPFRVEIEYEDGEKFTYVFSSELYLTIFNKKMKLNRDYHNSSLSKRYNIDIKLDKLCDVKLYSQIEKRGFLIIGKDEYKCLDTIRFSGVTVMSKS